MSRRPTIAPPQPDLRGNEIGDGTDIIQGEGGKTRRIGRVIRSDSADGRVVRGKGIAPRRGFSAGLDFAVPLALVAFDQDQVAGREPVQSGLQGRFRLVAQLVHQCPPVAGNDHHLDRASLPVPERVCLRLVDIESMVGMLHS